VEELDGAIGGVVGLGAGQLEGSMTVILVKAMGIQHGIRGSYR
jgi:hypothetical protein